MSQTGFNMNIWTTISFEWTEEAHGQSFLLLDIGPVAVDSGHVDNHKIPLLQSSRPWPVFIDTM